MFNSKKSQHGFSMIEVLASLVVIGVGLLGLSGLQIASMKGTNNAHSRNVATMLAMELSDRMRANQGGVEGGFYDNDVSCSTSVNQCRTSLCSPENIAKLDVQEVMCGVIKNSKREGGVANLLIGGTLTVERNTGCPGLIDPNKHKINISWTSFKIDDEQTDASQDQSIEICVIP
jgi:type IV pilus assembly protein PilV